MNEYIQNEIAKNIKGMSETLGRDESKYWYFAGKVEALSLLIKEMERKPFVISVLDDENIYVDTDSVQKLNVPMVKDTRSIKQRFNEMFGLHG